MCKDREQNKEYRIQKIKKFCIDLTKSKNPKPRQRGFTLIELMLVVIIIGVLAAMVVPKFTGRTEQAKIVRSRADINGNLGTAIDLFELDNGRYPKTENFPEALIKPPADLKDTWRGPYLKKKVPKDPWGGTYKYERSDEYLSGYKLWTVTPENEEINNLEE